MLFVKEEFSSCYLDWELDFCLWFRDDPWL